MILSRLFYCPPGEVCSILAKTLEVCCILGISVKMTNDKESSHHLNVWDQQVSSRSKAEGYNYLIKIQ